MEAKKTRKIYWCGLHESERFVPAPSLPPDVTIANVAAGHDHVYIIDDRGDVYGWGSSSSCLGSDSDNRGPVKIILPEEQKAVDATVDIGWGAILTDQGKVYTLEESQPPKLMEGTNNFKIEKMALYNYDTIFLTADGSLVTMYDSKVVATIPVPNHLKIKQIQRLQGPGFIFTTQDDELFYLDEKDSIVREDSVPNQLPVKQISAIERCVVLLEHPEWTPERHHLYPKAFKDIVVTLLMIGGLDKDKKPFHPECGLHVLPIELKYLILKFASLNYAETQVFSINSAHPSEWQEIPTKKIRMKEIAAGFAHIVFLSADGRVFTYQTGGENYGQMGVNNPSGLNAITDLEGKNVIHIYAGRYYSLALVEE